MDDVSASRGSGGGTLTVGALIAALSIFDFFIFAIPILVLAALFNPLIVFGIAAVVLFVISIAACNWVDRKWDAWIVGTRFEAKMQKVRSGKRARRPIEWIKRGSDLWFGLAAALLERDPSHRTLPAHHRTSYRGAPDRRRLRRLLALPRGHVLALRVRGRRHHPSHLSGRRSVSARQIALIEAGAVTRVGAGCRSGLANGRRRR